MVNGNSIKVASSPSSAVRCRPRMVRPKLPATERKSELLQVRTTAEERAKLVEAAASAGLTFSEWALRVLRMAARVGASEIGSQIDEDRQIEAPEIRSTKIDVGDPAKRDVRSAEAVTRKGRRAEVAPAPQQTSKTPKAKSKPPTATPKATAPKAKARPPKAKPAKAKSPKAKRIAGGKKLKRSR
jgi:hypothetical protein